MELTADQDSASSSVGMSLSQLLAKCKISYALQEAARFNPGTNVSEFYKLVQNVLSLYRVFSGLGFEGEAGALLPRKFTDDGGYVIHRVDVLDYFGWKPKTFEKKRKSVSFGRSIVTKHWKGAAPGMFHEIQQFIE